MTAGYKNTTFIEDFNPSYKDFTKILSEFLMEPNISVSTKNPCSIITSEGIPIELDFTDPSEEFFGIFKKNMGEFKSLYNITSIKIGTLYFLRKILDEKENTFNLSFLNRMNVPIITKMPIGATRLNRRVRQEMKTISFLKKNENICVETSMSPKRILDTMRCVKWGIPLSLNLKYLDYKVCSWILNDYNGIVRTIKVNCDVGGNIKGCDISFLLSFRNIICEKKIGLVIFYDGKFSKSAYSTLKNSLK